MMLKTFIKLKLKTCLVIKDMLQTYSFDILNFSTWVFPVLQSRFNYRIVQLHIMLQAWNIENGFPYYDRHFSKNFQNF